MLPIVVNRLYAPDIDLATHRVTRWLPLSTAAERPLSLVWIGPPVPARQVPLA